MKKEKLTTTLKIEGGEVASKLGIVEWNDACIYIKTGGQLSDTIGCVSVGYIFVAGKTIFVVHNTTNGVVDDFITIPKQWATKITYLRERRKP